MTKPPKTFEEIKEALKQEIDTLKYERESLYECMQSWLSRQNKILKQVNDLMAEEIELKERIGYLKRQDIPVVVKPPEPPKIIEYITKEQVEMLNLILDEYPKMATSLLKDKNIASFSKMDKDDFNQTMRDIKQRQRGIEKCPRNEW